MSILMDYLQEEAEKKKKSVKTWLEDAAKNADKCAWCTHVGKFTNPAVGNVVIDVLSKKPEHNGFLYTENMVCDKDISVSSASFLATAKLLALKLEDGRNVYQHFRDESPQIRQEVAALSIDFQKLREAMLKIKLGTVAADTDNHIRQVYFPIDEHDYHLLSVVPPSSLMLELTERAQTMAQNAREARNEKSEKYGQKYQRLLDLTCIGIGGSKPQNISYLNNKYHGETLMLPSFPPEISPREVVRPRKDFFANTLRFARFKKLFQLLHSRYARKQHNMETTLNVRSAEDLIIDGVFDYVYKLRAIPPGWSNEGNNALSAAQKIWLDNIYESQREQETDWKREIADSFARWVMITGYRKTMKEHALELGDAEFRALQSRIQEML